MTDLFSEIEQDLRREQASKLWEKYGIYVAGAAVAIILVASAVIGWRAWEKSRNEAASTRFDAVIAEAVKQKPEEAAKTLGDFAGSATSGYAAMARMHQAAFLSESGDNKGAVAVYDEVAGQSGLNDSRPSTRRTIHGATARASCLACLPTKPVNLPKPMSTLQPSFPTRLLPPVCATVRM